LEDCESIDHFGKHLRCGDWSIVHTVAIFILLKFVKNAITISIVHSFVVIISILQKFLFHVEIFRIFCLSLLFVNEEGVHVEVDLKAKEADPDGEVNLENNWVLLSFLALSSESSIVAHSKKTKENGIRDEEKVYHLSLSRWVLVVSGSFVDENMNSPNLSKSSTNQHDVQKPDCFECRRELICQKH